jgi:hypothetical protein
MDIEIEIGEKKVSIKNAGKSMIERIILEAIKCNHPKKDDILKSCFKKHKLKPHKKLNNDMSFIECSIKYDNHDTLCKYVTNITNSAPTYNIINLCVLYNKIDLLKKYSKEKRSSLDQCVNGDTPIITAIKKKYVECFNILIENNCSIHQPTPDVCNPFCVVLDEIMKDYNDNTLTEKTISIFENFIDKLLPIKFDSITVNEIKSELLKLIDKDDMYDSFLFEHAANNEERNDIFDQFLTKYNMTFCDHITSKIVELGENKLDIFINKIIDRRPHTLFAEYNDNKLVNFLLQTDCFKVIDNIIENYDDIIYHNDDILYLLFLNGKTDHAKILLGYHPEKAKSLTNEKKTLIEAVVLSTQMTDPQKIECIDYLIGLGADVNNINAFGLNIINIAIQYSTNEIVKHLSTHIDKKIKKKNLLEFACCFEKVDVLKTLIEMNYRIDKSDEDYVTNCVFVSLRLNNYELVEYIINEPKFCISEDNKKYLFKCANNINCSDQILTLLNNKYISHCTEKNINIMRLNGMFRNFIDRYRYSKKEDILSYAKMLILILLKIANNDITKICKSNFFYQEEKFIRDNELRISYTSIIAKCATIILHYEGITELRPNDIIDIITYSLSDARMKNVLMKYKKMLSGIIDKLEHASKSINELFGEIINGHYHGDFDDDNDEDDDSEYCSCCGKKAEEISDGSDTDINTDILSNEHTASDECENNDIGFTYDDLEHSTTNHKKKKNKQKNKKRKNHLVDQKEISIEDEKLKQHNDHIINDNSDEINETTDCVDKKINETVDELHKYYTSLIKIKQYPDISKIPKKTVTLNSDLITSLLARLIYPFTLNNYDVLKNLLSQKSVFYEDENKFNIVENNKLTAMIYKNSKEIIPTWITHYGYNICKEGKLDENHMFTFAIDILIFNLLEKENHSLKCSYRKINDENQATCIYFYGKALINERWQRGFFEYFLNDKNILFHRLFKAQL